MSAARAHKELISSLQEAVDARDTTLVRQLLENIHPADIADILYDFDTDESKYVINCYQGEKAVHIIIEIDEEIREKFLSTYSSQELADRFIQYMDTDDAVDIVAHLPNKMKDEVISHLEDVDFAADVVSLLHYDEDTAGGLMAKELVKVNINWSVSQCIEEIREQAENVSTVYTVYVVDNFDKLLGTLSLKSLILSKTSVKVEDLYRTDVISVSTHASNEEVSSIFEKYDLVVLPVIDALGKLVGRITIDDVVDVIKEDAERDYQLMSGIAERVESTDKVWVLSRARLPWLLIGLLGGILSSRYIALYEGELKLHPEMAFFIPLIAAMGGNVGIQSSAIIVRGLANNLMDAKDIFPKIVKETGVALINGLICSLIILSYNVFISDSMDLSITVSVALLTVIVFASIFGTVIPLVLDRMKIDPALATGPFITTTNDILGLAIYFIVGRMLY